MKSVSAVDQYQIIQNPDFSIDVRIKSDSNQVSEAEILGLIRSLINDSSIPVKVSINEKFVLNQNQKHKTVISYVN